MKSREQIKSLFLIGVIFTMMVVVGGYFLVYRPIQQAQSAEAALDKEIADLEKQVTAQKQAHQRLATARYRSLPADPELAQREYTIALEQIIKAVGAHGTVTRKVVPNTSREVPEISKGKPIYNRLACEVTLNNADMWVIKDFMQAYYQLGLLQQITALNIAKKDEGNVKAQPTRNNLTVTLTTEAIIVDGAEQRKTLLPVPTAYAGLGGGALYKAVSLTPEFARKLRPTSQVTTLSPVKRDYSLLVRKDPFYGPLPVETTSDKPPIKLATIRDVKIKSGEKKSVNVVITGSQANNATFNAIAQGGGFIPEGPLKTNPKEYSIELPAFDASEGTSTIMVTATTADGKFTEKTTFKVTVEESEKPPAPAGEDISAFVVLIGTTRSDDGTAWASIKDNATRLRYEIEASPKGVKVTKEWFVLEWKKDRDYEEAPGVLHITAKEAATNRTFQVIAVNAEGIIVADLKSDHAAQPPKKGPGKGGPPKDQHRGLANAWAAIAGNRITPALKPKPKLYRWEVGQPLSKIEEIPEAQATEILKTAEANGPVFDVAASGK